MKPAGRGLPVSARRAGEPLRRSPSLQQRRWMPGCSGRAPGKRKSADGHPAPRNAPAPTSAAQRASCYHGRLAPALQSTAVAPEPRSSPPLPVSTGRALGAESRISGTSSIALVWMPPRCGAAHAAAVQAPPPRCLASPLRRAVHSSAAVNEAGQVPATVRQSTFAPTASSPSPLTCSLGTLKQHGSHHRYGWPRGLPQLLRLCRAGASEAAAVPAGAAGTAVFLPPSCLAGELLVTVHGASDLQECEEVGCTIRLRMPCAACACCLLPRLAAASLALSYPPAPSLGALPLLRSGATWTRSWCCHSAGQLGWHPPAPRAPL